MKKIALLLTALMLTACNLPVEEPVATPAEEEIPEKDALSVSPLPLATSGEYEIVLNEDRSMASCAAYDVLGAEGEPISMPEEVREALDCSFPELSPAQPLFAYIDGYGNMVKTFDILSGEVRDAFDLPEDGEGSDLIWTKEGDKLVHISVSQLDPNGPVRLYVYDYADEKFTLSKSENLNAAITCGSICYMVEDYWITEDGVFKYHEWTSEMEDRPENLRAIEL